MCWLWEKVKSTEDRDFQRFLDNVQYKISGILRYERVFGEGFVSTGGVGEPTPCLTVNSPIIYDIHKSHNIPVS